MPRWSSTGVFLLTLLAAAPRTAGAGEDPDGGLASSAPAEVLSPPVLKNRTKALYPPEALARRQEATVGLELRLDAEGLVLDARVISPAGQGFDEAALEAARQFRFEPAKRNGVAIASTVKFSYEFHLSPAPAPVVPDAPLATPPGEVAEESSPDYTTVVVASRPISAASSFAVQERAFNLRPIASVQDILRVTPGLLTVQHSGGGKANQYFLRGFDADHGTDLALSIDGMPINLVAHAHGQGYADTNFIIPEVVERVEITKGPYFAGQGDFATAGAVNMVSRDDFEHSSAGAGFVDSPGHGEAGYRALAIASPKFHRAKATFAAEIGRTNGPFDHPDSWDKYKLWNKVTVPIGSASSITVGEMSYAGNWNGSGQIPARAVEEGLVGRFGSLDPSEGGNTARHQVFAALRLRPTEFSELRALAYAASYRFNLFSNFTLLLDDPVNGDQIEQIDRRVIYGGRVSYRVVRHPGAVAFDTTIGGETRNDDIHLELWHTKLRQQLAPLRNDDVHESFLAAFINEEITPVKWLRLDLGGRVDLLSFAVDSHLNNGGVGAAHQWSPKTSLVVSPIDHPKATLDFYVNYGHGFHSNDVRGVFAQPPVTPLTRAKGEEIGTRAPVESLGSGGCPVAARSRQ
jgi:TonB family protein